MIIRCERCSTVYELEDGVLPPEGSDVQCARCQHVFRALPPQAQTQTSHAPATPEPPPSVPKITAPPPAETAPVEAAAAPSGRRPSVYRPPISQPSMPRAPVFRRDAVGTFESRLRRTHRWRWLAPTILLVAAGAAFALYRARDARVEDGAEEARARALTLALADDVRSLELAAAALQSVVESAPQLHAARADRALVELLLAGALSEHADGEQKERARALEASASATLEELARANLAKAEVARARAVAASLSGSADLKGLATQARANLAADPFVAFAEYAADVRSTDRSARERALGELRLLLARRPELLRARYLLAKGLALAGRQKEALAAADEVLERNPRHECAAGLRESITHPPATAPIAAPDAQPAPAPALDVAAAEPPPPPEPVAVEKPAALPRKPSSTGGEPALTPSAEPASDEGAVGGELPAPGDTEPPPPPRLRPAAVPEPEVVEGGG